MKQDAEKMVKRLSFENFIWIVFIVISLLDIYGDELIKKNLLYNDKEAIKKANKLFLRLSTISILIYIYFLTRNYYDYKKYKNKSYAARLVGSTLILIGTLCLFYFQMTTTKQVDSSSNV